MTKNQMSIPKANYDHWKRMDTWRIIECVFLLYGIEPPPAPHLLNPAVLSRTKITIPEKDWERIKETFEVAIRSFESENSIRPGKFLKWAKSKGYEVPPPLQNFDVNEVNLLA